MSHVRYLGICLPHAKDYDEVVETYWRHSDYLPRYLYTPVEAEEDYHQQPGKGMQPWSSTDQSHPSTYLDRQMTDTPLDLGFQG